MLKKGDSIVIGVSGGADSVALLFVLLELRKDYDLRLEVVHVNHGLRPEAAKEAEYVETLCKENEIHFFLREIDVNKLSLEMGRGTEETGRIMRYRIFDELCEKNGKIAVAHNMNDLAETMLFNLWRGTGPKGLAGIAPVRGNIIRPLLCVERTEIEEFLSELKIKYCTDSSNLTDDYTRNRIRNNIIPLIRKDVAERAVPHMFETAGQLEGLNDFAAGFTKEVFGKIATCEEGEVSFSREEFRRQHPYIKNLLVKEAIDRLVPGNRDITSLHIGSVACLADSEGSKEVDLPYGIKATSGYKAIKLSLGRKEIKTGIEPVEIAIPGETVVAGFGTIRCSLLNLCEIPEISRKEYTKCLDYDRISRPLLIRRRQSGDMITVAENGRKKLKDFLIDCKVDRAVRDSLPLIAAGSDIVWIPGLRLSEAYKITKDTKTVLIIDIFKEDIC
ncbi:MAG: tRNA lysidine(34) synthetase TilS [Lachnospiraceae bacterium]|nr:tRNA lysidine(34) synthetase TilS [Lachnospiraceae bacterium]